MILGTSVLCNFQQIGIWDEFRSIGKPFIAMELLNETLELVTMVDFSERESMCELI